MVDYVDLERAEIPGLDGFYCDKYGNVYHGDRVLKIGSHRGIFGYVRIGSNANGVVMRKLCTVAKLMGLAWLGASDDDTICFRDGDRTNFMLDNLYIGSRSELLKTHRKFLRDSGVDSLNILKENHRTCIEVLQLDPYTKEIVARYKSLHDAADVNDIPVYNIERCCNNHKRTCNGYYWCYSFDYDVYSY